jgi:hypothetical protein
MSNYNIKGNDIHGSTAIGDNAKVIVSRLDDEELTKLVSEFKKLRLAENLEDRDDTNKKLIAIEAELGSDSPEKESKIKALVKRLPGEIYSFVKDMSTNVLAEVITKSIYGI